MMLRAGIATVGAGLIACAVACSGGLGAVTSHDYSARPSVAAHQTDCSRPNMAFVVGYPGNRTTPAFKLFAAPGVVVQGGERTLLDIKGQIVNNDLFVIRILASNGRPMTVCDVKLSKSGLLEAIGSIGPHDSGQVKVRRGSYGIFYLSSSLGTTGPEYFWIPNLDDLEAPVQFTA